jgi:hypothetical protein
VPAHSGPDDVVALIHAGQEDVAEVEGPDPVVDFLETEHVLLERVRDKEHALLEPDGPGVRHPLRNVVARVVERGDAARVGRGEGR